MSIFSAPKSTDLRREARPIPPPTPAAAPTRANASVINAGRRTGGLSSLISTGVAGLQRKSTGIRRTLIGGGTA